MWQPTSPTEPTSPPPPPAPAQEDARQKNPGRRFAQIVRLKPEYVAEYKECHAKVWPEVLKQIRDCNIRDCVLALVLSYLSSSAEICSTLLFSSQLLTKRNLKKRHNLVGRCIWYTFCQLQVYRVRLCWRYGENGRKPQGQRVVENDRQLPRELREGRDKLGSWRAELVETHRGGFPPGIAFPFSFFFRREILGR